MKKSLYILSVLGICACTQPTPEGVALEPVAEAAVDTNYIDAPISEALTAYGSLEMLPNSNVRIHSFFEGRVKEVKVLEGQSVQAGDVLATLESAELIAQQERYYTSGSDRVQAQQELERNQALHAVGSLADKVLAESRAAFNAADIAWKAAAAQLRMAGVQVSDQIPEQIQSELVLRSPVAGQVTAIAVNRGDRVTREDEVMRVASSEGLRAEVLLRADRAFTVNPGDTCWLVRIGDTEQHPAIVEVLIPLADAANNTIKVRCRLVSAGKRSIQGERVMIQFGQTQRATASGE
jgi:RND family efflux transporter MFP subunit